MEARKGFSQRCHLSGFFCTIDHGAVGNAQLLSFECVKATCEQQRYLLLRCKCPRARRHLLEFHTFSVLYAQIFVEWLPRACHYSRSRERRGEDPCAVRRPGAVWPRLTATSPVQRRGGRERARAAVLAVRGPGTRRGQGSAGRERRGKAAGA